MEHKQEWEKEFGRRFRNGATSSGRNDEIVAFISLAIQKARKEENNAWTRGERCYGCGKGKDNDLSDSCTKCLETA